MRARRWRLATSARVGALKEGEVPVRTRLRQSGRQLLDSLVDAGVARSRSDALGWCVRRVGERGEAWPAELREAMRTVEQVRDAGPDLR